MGRRRLVRNARRGHEEGRKLGGMSRVEPKKRRPPWSSVNEGRSVFFHAIMERVYLGSAMCGRKIAYDRIVRGSVVCIFVVLVYMFCAVVEMVPNCADGMALMSARNFPTWANPYIRPAMTPCVEWIDSFTD